MEKLPNIVRERLQAGAAGEHPDADLLTAFAERSLSERERKEVASHLSHCGDCREILILAVGEPASTVPSLRVRPSDRWLRWPVLRWGALAACLVVGGAAVVIGYRPRDKVTPIEPMVLSDRQAASPEPAAQNEAADRGRETSPAMPAERRAEQSLGKLKKPPVPSSRDKSSPQIAEQAAPKAYDYLANAPARTAKPDSSSTAAASRLSAPPTTPKAESKTAPGGIGGGVFKANSANTVARRDESVTVTGQATTVLTMPRPAAPPPAADMGSAEIAAEKPPAGTVVFNQAAKVPAAAPTRQAESATLAKNKKDQPGVGGATAGTAYGANRAVLDTAASTPAGLMRDLKPPTWTLSEDGLPQRSFDSGGSWEKIQVDYQAGFRALSASGMEVWVGGQG